MPVYELKGGPLDGAELETDVDVFIGSTLRLDPRDGAPRYSRLGLAPILTFEEGTHDDSGQSQAESSESSGGTSI